MNEVSIRDEFIRLGQAMKLAGIGEGADMKHLIQSGEVKVNGETEERRGRKLHRGDIFQYGAQEYKIV